MQTHQHGLEEPRQHGLTQVISMVRNTDQSDPVWFDIDPWLTQPIEMVDTDPSFCLSSPNQLCEGMSD